MSQRHLRVLVVDDEDDTRDLLSMLLENAGIGCEVASTGGEALRKAQEEVFDAILLDLGLPDIDGWEVCRRLKKDPRTSAVRVVVLTGHAMTADRQRAVQAGCDTILLKPAEVSEILGALNA